MPAYSFEIALVILLLSSPNILGQSTPAAPNAAENLIRLHEAWGPKASTPGTSLVLKESMRSGRTIKHRLIATGLPSQGTYSLVAWPVTQKAPSASLTGVTLDASGLAICAGKPDTCGSADSPNDPIDITTQPIPGEPLRLGLVSADGATRVFATIIPIPLRGEDKGCTVDAVLLTPAAELVVIEGSGLPPNSDVTMDSHSEGEHQTGSGKTNSEGRYTTAILPYTKGATSGVAKVMLKAAKCSPIVSVSWGRRQ